MRLMGIKLFMQTVLNNILCRHLFQFFLQVKVQLNIFWDFNTVTQNPSSMRPPMLQQALQGRRNVFQWWGFVSLPLSIMSPSRVAAESSPLSKLHQAQLSSTNSVIAKELEKERCESFHLDHNHLIISNILDYSNNSTIFIRSFG